MKHLLTLTLVAILGIAVVGCNKTTKVNASATASQCDGSNCDPATCGKVACAAKRANCTFAGTPQCPLAAAKAAQAKPAAAGNASKSCCFGGWKTKAKPAAANLIDCPLEGTPECPFAAGKIKPAAAGKPSCCASKK